MHIHWQCRSNNRQPQRQWGRIDANVLEDGHGSIEFNEDCLSIRCNWPTILPKAPLSHLNHGARNTGYHGSRLDIHLGWRSTPLKSATELNELLRATKYTAEDVKAHPTQAENYPQIPSLGRPHIRVWWKGGYTILATAGIRWARGQTANAQLAETGKNWPAPLESEASIRSTRKFHMGQGPPGPSSECESWLLPGGWHINA